MIKKYAFYFVIHLLLLINHLNADNSFGQGDSVSLAKLPAFEDYPIQEDYTGKVALVDLNSYAGASTYRTRLQEGSQAGPNFAGHYTVVTIGAGSNHQNQWIIEAKTGKILGNFLTHFGIAYRPDSNLLILNPPSDELKQLYKAHPDAPLWEGKTTYLTWENDEPKVLYEEDTTKLLSLP
jgi:hypothetical protein